MDTVRVAMIGAGTMARRHLEVLGSLPGVEIAAVSSRGIDKLQKLASDFGVTQFRSNEEMLRQVRPDAVVVAVSVASVYDVALTCIRRGVSALIEKPPGLNVAQTEKLLKAAKGISSQYMVGLNRRFYSVIQNAQKVISDKGPLASVLVQAPENMADIRAMNFHPPEVLDRWMVANGMHCIDLLRFLGGKVVSIHALSSTLQDRDHSNFGALLKFDNGAIGHYISNWAAPGRWGVTLFGLDVRVDLSPLEEGRVTERDGSVTEIPKDAVDVKYKPGFHAQDKYLVEHIRQNMPIERPAANLEDALETTKLIEAIAYADRN